MVRLSNDLDKLVNTMNHKIQFNTLTSQTLLVWIFIIKTWSLKLFKSLANIRYNNHIQPVQLMQ